MHEQSYHGFENSCAGGAREDGVAASRLVLQTGSCIDQCVHGTFVTTYGGNEQRGLAVEPQAITFTPRLVIAYITLVFPALAAHSITV